MGCPLTGVIGWQAKAGALEIQSSAVETGSWDMESGWEIPTRCSQTYLNKQFGSGISISFFAGVLLGKRQRAGVGSFIAPQLTASMLERDLQGHDCCLHAPNSRRDCSAWLLESAPTRDSVDFLGDFNTNMCNSSVTWRGVFGRNEVDFCGSHWHQATLLAEDPARTLTCYSLFPGVSGDMDSKWVMFCTTTSLAVIQSCGRMSFWC